jgi:hypothetical protein
MAICSNLLSLKGRKEGREGGREIGGKWGREREG